MRRIFLYFLVLFFLSTPLQAQEMTGLEIEALFDKYAALYTAEKPDLKEILETRTAHTADEAEFNLMIKTNRSEDIREKSFSRAEYLDELSAEYDGLRDSSLRYTITDIRYSDDKTRADVDYTSLFSGAVEIEGREALLDTERAIVKFKAFSRCTSGFVLDEEVIKTYREDCKVEALYSQPEEINEE